MSTNLKGLIGKLNDTSRNALEAAAGFCLSRTHYDIEIEHFLSKLLEATDTDLSRIMKQFGVNRSHLAGDLTRSLDKLKSGNARTPVFSPSLVQTLSDSWTIGSIDFGSAQIRSGFTLLALVSTQELSRIAKDISREFQKSAPKLFSAISGISLRVRLRIARQHRPFLSANRECALKEIMGPPLRKCKIFGNSP